MIEVEIDNWSGCYAGTCFTVSLEVLPRDGDSILIHRECFSKEMLENTDSFPIEFNENNLSENTVVANIYHVVTSTSHKASINIYIDGQ